MKNFKTFYEAQTASRLKEIIQLLQHIKASYVSGTNIQEYADIQEYTDICFPRALRMKFLGVQKRCCENVSSATKQNVFAGKFKK